MRNDCGARATEWQPELAAPSPAMPRSFDRKASQRCYRCATLLGRGNTSGLCRKCSAASRPPPKEAFEAAWEGSRERGRRFVRGLATTERHRLDRLGLAIVDLMAQKELSFSEAAARWGYKEPWLRAIVCPWVRKHEIAPRTFAHLATALGEASEREWSEAQWLAELRSCVSAREPWRKEEWIQNSVACIESHDPFVMALRDRLVTIDRMRWKSGGYLSLTEVAETVRVSPIKFMTWLGAGMSRGREVPLRPRRHHIPGVACLFLGTGAEVDDLDAEIQRLSALLGWPKPHHAGCLILRKLWEQGLSVRSLPVGTEAARRIMYEGVSTADVRQRIATTLKLTHEEQKDPKTWPAASDGRLGADKKKQLGHANAGRWDMESVLQKYREKGEVPSGRTLAREAHVRVVTAQRYLRRRGLEGTTPRSRAESFLREYLGTGGRRAAAVVSDAEAQGITGITLRRAAKKIGVRAVPQRRLGDNSYAGWCWELPTEPDDQSDSRVQR